MWNRKRKLRLEQAGFIDVGSLTEILHFHVVALGVRALTICLVRSKGGPQ